MTCSMIFQGGNYMLVFHRRNEEGKVRIQLLDRQGKQVAETYEPYYELRQLTALMTE